MDNNILNTSSAIPLTLTAIEDTAVQITEYSSFYHLSTVQYNLDGTDWTDYTYGTSISLSAGHYIQWQGSSSTFGKNTVYGTFQITGAGNVAASGNCLSLINYNTTLGQQCFQALFKGCTKLISAPELPIVDASGLYCCKEMFSGCDNLVAAPELPAKIIGSSCYSSMFENCTSLVTPPSVLPASTADARCYLSMFGGCTSLLTPPDISATTLDSYCYSNMFAGCTSLTAVPVLPVTRLYTDCYKQMFSGCTSLQISDTQTTDATYAFRLPPLGTFTYTYAQSNMFAGCAGTRSSDNMAGAAGNSYTYYTQNLPVSTPIRYVDVGGIQRKLRADNAINDDLGNNIAETYAKNTDPDIEILNNAVENKGIGYVTGKTYTPVFTDISVTCTKDYNNTYYGYSSDISGPFEINLPAYRITINSNTFVTTSINCNDSLDWYTVYLGNAYLISDSYPNTGESYCVASGIFSSGGSTKLCVALDSTWGSGESSIVANISVTEIHNIYSQIDRNCIPPEGNNATASGRYSHAEGFYTTASGEFSHAEGNSTTASGHASHAEGYYTTASGDYSHAEGQATEASGEFSHVEGYDTEANNEDSHAEGNSTTASGHASHAEGYFTTASGNYSHAECHGTSALGEDSHAQNTRTIAQGNSQTALGRYNIADTTSAVIIGNGTNYNARSNALTIDWSGNVVAAGSISGSKIQATSNAYTTTAPTADNPDGLKFVLLSSEPATKYNGWVYLIKE